MTREAQARYADAFRREIFILRSCHDRNIVQFLGACLQVRGVLGPVPRDCTCGMPIPRRSCRACTTRQDLSACLQAARILQAPPA